MFFISNVKYCSHLIDLMYLLTNPCALWNAVSNFSNARMFDCIDCMRKISLSHACRCPMNSLQSHQMSSGMLGDFRGHPHQPLQHLRQLQQPQVLPQWWIHNFSINFKIGILWPIKVNWDGVISEIVLNWIAQYQTVMDFGHLRFQI